MDISQNESGIGIDMPFLGTKSKKEFFDDLVKIAVKQLSVSNKFKEPLVTKWKMFDELRAGKVKRKLRSQFNVVLPVFSGMLDTLESDFDEPVELEFKHKHPSDYFNAIKVQAAWNLQKNKTDKDARWDYKSRIDKKNNLMYGRSFIKEFALSDPSYKNVLSAPDPLYMHTQPMGGGLLENHLFSGEEAIIKTAGEIEAGAAMGLYDKEQVKELLARARNPENIPEVTEFNREKMARFSSSGLNAQENDYVGESTYNLCEWVLTYKGKRYYLLFDPWTMTWIRGEKLSDIFSKDLFPWSSWACFEDGKVFWTQGYSDIIYPIADAVHTLFNQELTNREKQNLNARGYDKDMFPDVAKLDAAQYRPDALVPVDTKGGTREISKGIYEFKTPELTGTINLLDWINKTTQKDTGVNDVSQGASQSPNKKVNVAYMEQGSIAKRIGHKSQSYTEAWGEVGTRFIQGLKDHMTEEMYIEVVGDMGIEPDVLTREDLDFEKELGVYVISSSARKAESQKKKEDRIKALGVLAQSQNVNSEWRDAAVLRDIGGYSEEEIRVAMDTKNYNARESVAKAHIAIQELLGREKPNFNFAADVTFLKIITDYMMDHRHKLGKDRFKKFAEYVTMHAKTAQENAQRAGEQRGMQNARKQQLEQANNPSGRAPNKTTPSVAPEATQIQQ